ncbi:TonB-dependent receptor [Pelagicoccus enzymogenes]|uniref:TonB-dependent receptor n=1 Tax=Pelagicoccus enzymogenes TaxID=2773457 RepID=UPI00280E3AB4|nr:TonB-dependent receptor [Pelagicoccus enzymogenes]MDQ8199838.1 TonB-dependent receptor [Pelagicoccus enzymogenes]
MTPKINNLEEKAPLFSAKSKKSVGLSLAMLMAISGGASQAFAQDDDDKVFELDAFVVENSIRDSLAAGVEIKKNNRQMIDALVAEDIGKFPDNNVVEALQRVAGVQTTDRARGEVNTVTIRGLNDVTTTVNGRNIFTSSGRSVALADIPASLVNRVNVYKTRSASQIEHGIAGVIDVRTQRPFNFDGQKTVIAARGIYSELADEFDPNVSALFSNVWETDGGKFGALFNVSFAESNWTDKSITSGAMVPFVTENPPADFTFAPLERLFTTHPSAVENPLWQPGLEAGLPFNEGATLPLTPVSGGATQQVPYYLTRDAVFSADFYGKRERPAANLSLQFAPDDNSTYTFEAFYNGYRESFNNNLMFSLADWWGNPGDFELIPGTNIIKERTVGNPFAFMSGDRTEQKTDSYLYALSGEWQVGSNLSLTADLSHQKSEFSVDFLAIQTNRIPPSITVDFNAGGGVPAFSFGDNPDTPIDESDLTVAELWNIGPFFDNADRDEGDATEFKIDGVYELNDGFFENIAFGLRYDMRGASEADYRGAVSDLNQPLANYPEMQYINSGYYDGRTDIPASAMVINADYLSAERDTVRGLYGYPTSSDITIAKNFEIDEKTLSAYLQTDFMVDFGDQALSGQFGVRYVEVDRDLDFITSTASTSGDSLLPNAVVLYDITPDLRLRASYGETVRYPGFGALNPNITYVEDVTNIGYGTASGGNPNLAPTESKNYDLSLERYFGDKGANMVYATAFKREIDGLVIDFVNRVTFEGYDYILSQPDNASNGELDGMEFGLVWFPENLPDWAEGFGIQASYTTLDSIQDIPITNDAGEIVGTDTTPFFAVSDSSYSVVLAYEKERFSSRLSYVWRDDFLHHYEARLFANPLGVYNTAQQSLDLQFSYNVSDNMVLTLDATNLTDEEFHSYYEYPDTHNFGNWLISRTISVGARYSF